MKSSYRKTAAVLSALALVFLAGRGFTAQAKTEGSETERSNSTRSEERRENRSDRREERRESSRRESRENESSSENNDMGVSENE